MTVPVAAAAPHTDAVIAALTTAGMLTGRGEMPPGGGWASEPGRSNFARYAVVYPYPGRTSARSLGEVNGALTYVFQVTVVGANSAQAEAALDRVRAVLVGATLSVAGRTAFPVYQELERMVTRDDQVSPPVHYGSAQFHFQSEPA